jgi:4-amino-4-deoxy-L-arabinose transferase-like glycosyltransferase
MKKALISYINALPTWFRIALVLIFSVYIAGWVYTIYLSHTQTNRGIKPVLPIIQGDSEEYYYLAESLLDGREFSLYGHPETFRSPGYPVFIAAIKFATGSYFGVTIFQIFVVFATSLLIEKLGREYDNPLVGQLSALFFLISPITFTLSLTILSEVFYIFVFIFTYSFIIGRLNARNNLTVLPALLIAVAIYVRPMGIFALPIFLAPIFAAKEKIKFKIVNFLAVSLVAFIFMLPWYIRNKKISGVFAFSSLKSFNLAKYNIPIFLSNLNGTTVEQETIILQKVSMIPEDNWRDLKYSSFLDKHTMKIILSNPVSYAKFHIISSMPFLFSSSLEFLVHTYESSMRLNRQVKPSSIWYLTKGEINLFIKNISGEWWEFSERILLLLIIFLSAYGIWVNRKKPYSYVFIFFILYSMILTGPVANARYRVPVEPFLMILSMSGFISICKNMRFKTYV